MCCHRSEWDLQIEPFKKSESSLGSAERLPLKLLSTGQCYDFLRWKCVSLIEGNLGKRFFLVDFLCPGNVLKDKDVFCLCFVRVVALHFTAVWWLMRTFKLFQTATWALHYLLFLILTHKLELQTVIKWWDWPDTSENSSALKLGSLSVVWLTKQCIVGQWRIRELLAWRKRLSRYLTVRKQANMTFSHHIYIN